MSSSRKLRNTFAVASLLLAACNSTPTDTGPHYTNSFVIAPLATWAGGTVQIRAADFHYATTGASVKFGDSTVTLVRVDDSTMTARVPSTLAGAITPAVKLTDTSTAVNASAITVYGFVESTSYAQQLADDIYVWPRDGHAKIMGAASLISSGGPPTSVAGLTFIDLDAKSTTNYPGIINPTMLRGPGATYQDSVFLLKSVANGPIEAWRVLPTPTLLESHPEVVTSRQAMRLGPTTWFTSSNHTFAYPGAAGGSNDAEETEGVFISPRKDRATVTVDHIATLDGVPVLSMPSGQLAFTVSGLRSSQGVDFSTDGSQLMMVGGITGWPEGNARIVLLNATSGAIIHDTTISRSAYAVALDPVRPYFYVGVNRPAAAANYSLPVILVFERSTFKLVGEVTVPASAPTCLYNCYKGVIAVSNAPALYLFWGYNGPSRSYKFSMPPVGQ